MNGSLVLGARGILAEPAVPAETHDAEEGFAEDASRHLRDSLAAVDEDDGNFLDLETYLIGGVLHLDLEAVTLEANLVELDGLEDATLVALEAGCGVVDLEARDEAHILRREIAHQHSADRPVDDVHSADVAGADGKIVAFVVTGCIESRQIVGIVREVSVHLEDVIVLVVECPAEACDVGGAESELAGPFDDKQAVGELRLHETMHDLRGAVGGAVVDDEDVELVACRLHSPITGIDDGLAECENGTDDFLDVLLLVVGRDDDNAIAH